MGLRCAEHRLRVIEDGRCALCPAPERSGTRQRMASAALVMMGVLGGVAVGLPGLAPGLDGPGTSEAAASPLRPASTRGARPAATSGARTAPAADDGEPDESADDAWLGARDARPAARVRVPEPPRAAVDLEPTAVDRPRDPELR